MKAPTLYLIIPCYNEQEVLPITAPSFLNKINQLVGENLISDNSRVMFVDDGSKDNTWNIIKQLSEKDFHYIGIQQSRNRGQQSSSLAGLMEARDLCDITITIDCDGQDDINAIDNMVKEYLNGCEVVYGVRSKRDKDTFFKRFTAECYYKLLIRMGIEINYNHSEYRLVSSRVLKEFSKFEEVNLFLRGLFPLVGFKSTCVYYERNERIAGESKYPLSKMLSLAFEGITSLSIAPIKMITTLGIVISIVSFLLILYVLVSYFAGVSVSGWPSTLITVCFIGGIQLIALGIIGEYIGKIYLETKRRPRYIISEKTYEDDRQE